MVKDTRTFDTQEKAWQFLDDEGWKATSSTFNRHCLEGKVAENKFGLFEAETLLAYAGANLKRKASNKKKSREEVERAARKAEAEILLLERKAERERVKLEKENGKLIDRGDIEREFGARAGILSAMYKSAVQKTSRELIELVEGNPGKTGDLIRILTEMFDDMATKYANMKTFEIELGDESSV